LFWLQTIAFPRRNVRNKKKKNEESFLQRKAQMKINMTSRTTTAAAACVHLRNVAFGVEFYMI